MSKITSLLLMFLSLSIIELSAEPIVVVNESVPVSTIDKNNSSKIFLGKQSVWDDDTTIVIAVLKSGEIHDDFMKNVVKKSPSQFTSYWKKIVFSGKGVMPKSFGSESELVAFVSKTKGAIGYIDSGTSLDGVKSVKFE